MQKYIASRQRGGAFAPPLPPPPPKYASVNNATDSATAAWLNEVEDKAMFSLHSVAEEFTTWKSYAKMRVISH